MWGVQQESSTGVLNDLPGLVELARVRNVRVSADCVSSLGAVPIEASGLFLASGTSGKALGSYAGLAIVLADAQAVEAAAGRVPSALDLHAAVAESGPLSTIPSPPVRALSAALGRYATAELAGARYAAYAALGRLMRPGLASAGLAPLADEACASPVITTFAPPAGLTSSQFVRYCARAGFEIAGHSDYLTARNLVQVATFGAVTRKDCLRFLQSLGQWTVEFYGASTCHVPA